MKTCRLTRRTVAAAALTLCVCLGLLQEANGATNITVDGKRGQD